MTKYILLLVGPCLLLTGCAHYELANGFYQQNPDLSDVTFATGIRSKERSSIGMAYGVAEGDDCDKVAGEAVRSMVAEAKAMGGARVIQAQFRQKHNWTGRPTCLNSMGGSRVEVRGMVMPALKDPSE